VQHQNSASEAVTVIREAALAVSSGDEQTVIDCAYHLEDFISRLRNFIYILNCHYILVLQADVYISIVVDFNACIEFAVNNITDV